MNKEESLALFRQGRAVWNTWAEERLTERRKLEEAGDWIEGSNPDKQNDATRAWHKTATADFSGHEFKGLTDFSGFVSPGPALFNEAAFSGNAWFSEATFSGNAEFSEATCSGNAWFSEAAFSGHAWFGAAVFKGYAGFNKAVFKGYAVFNKAAFNGYAEFGAANFSKTASFVQTDFTGFTSFDHCRFEEYASYRAIQASRSFSLTHVWFGQVPDFTQARFAESPELDTIRIKPQRGWPRSLADLAARWRALKRLAVAAHDHNRELLFWKGEVLARRWSVDKPWHALFYFGLFYGWLSDFGRSVVRPLIGWALGWLVFAWHYLSQQLGDGWLCEEPGKTLTAALGLSLRNALVLPGSGSATRLDQIYACLYGIHGGAAMTPAPLPARFQPVIPDAIAFAGVLQNLWSAVMLFLLFLALRNHFRIK